MQDSDFDKIFSHKFGQIPGEPYAEENWSELSRRLSNYEKRRQPWVLPVLLPLLGLLAAGNVFWWYQWREMTRTGRHTAHQTSLVETDTVIRRTVVYRYDTVYQNITLIRRHHSSSFASTGQSLPEETLHAVSPPGLNLTPAVTAIHQNPPAGLPPAQPGPDGMEPHINPAAAQAQDSVKQQIVHDNAVEPGRSTIHTAQVDTSARAAQPLVEKPTVAADPVFEQLLDAPPPTKKVRSQSFLYFARPRLGIAALLGLPNVPQKRSGSVFGAGFRGDVEIVRNLRLGAEVAYQHAGLKADETEILEEMDIKIPKPGGGFKLKYWETYSLPVFAYSLYLRYEIPLQGSWTPWVALGSQLATYLPFEMEFEFENETNNLELHVPVKSESETRWQGLLLQAGADCRLGEHLSLGLGGYLLRGFEEEAGLLDNQIGLKTSLIYKF